MSDESMERDGNDMTMGSDPDWKAVAGELHAGFGLDRAERISAAEAEALLAERLNAMARNDFNGLVALLYRIDIHEGKLRERLKEQPDADAGLIMAQMVIERLWQKAQTRKQFGGGGGDGSGGGGPAEWKEV